MTQFSLSAESLGLRAEDLHLSFARSVLAEFIGTMLFVFIGCGAVVSLVNLTSDPSSSATVVGIAMAHGLAIAGLVAATAKLSGGHINPAVTITTIFTGQMKAGPALVYVIAQLAGAVVGAFLLQTVITDAAEGNLGLHTINTAAVDGTGAAVVIEAILTFILVFTVFATAVDPRGPSHLAPIAIGLAVLFDHIVAVPMTGASMNPARSFGPAVVTGEWDDQWVYWVGPIIGGLLAGLLYVTVYLKRDEEPQGETRREM